ncbi:MAG: YdcF family protein [Lachnospiraceae bacterium]|nr:YdcF family protein [Lachnospiraceae bacterium]
MIVNILKKYVLYLVAFIIFVYIIICDILMTFSISMNMCFFAGIILLVLFNYLINNPVRKEVRSPSFFYIFIKVSTILYFATMTAGICFNVFSQKNFLDDKMHFDYIIVFGAGISENKNEIMNGRLEKAIEYAKRYNRCKFVLTGAKGENEPITEAAYMSKYMGERGVAGNRIIVDPFSINTNENIVNSLELIRKDAIKRNARDGIITRPFLNTPGKFDLDFMHIGFMSSDFHLTRINMMAKKYGIHLPYDIVCETKLLYRPYLYVRENLSLYKAFVLKQLSF